MVLVANSARLDLLQNAMLHYDSLPGGGPNLAVHGLDDLTHRTCLLFKPSGRGGKRTSSRSLGPGLGSMYQTLQIHRHSSGATPASRIACVRAPMLNVSRYGAAEAVLMYKLQAAWREAQRTEQDLRGASIILLDIDALVLRRSCFEEWYAFPEAIVAQAGGCPGCTPRVCRSRVERHTHKPLLEEPLAGKPWLLSL